MLPGRCSRCPTVVVRPHPCPSPDQERGVNTWRGGCAASRITLPLHWGVARVLARARRPVLGGPAQVARLPTSADIRPDRLSQNRHSGLDPESRGRSYRGVLDSGLCEGLRRVLRQNDRGNEVGREVVSPAPWWVDIMVWPLPPEIDVDRLLAGPAGAHPLGVFLAAAGHDDAVLVGVVDERDQVVVRQLFPRLAGSALDAGP